LNEQTRQEDIVARVGGEEFVIIFDHCTAIEANQKAESIRLATALLKPNEVTFTVSIGISELNLNGEKFCELLARADKAKHFRSHARWLLFGGWTHAVFHLNVFKKHSSLSSI
jgi:diguanylate cyclase (GGDEF)-like protein